jgi:hypothetical protein
LLAANEGRDRLEIQSTEICTEQPEEEEEEKTKIYLRQNLTVLDPTSKCYLRVSECVK